VRSSRAEASPERQIAVDLVRRSLPVTPPLLLVSGVVWGVDGVLSSAYALALVLANFVLAATLLTWAARISPAFLMGAALFGYLLRLGLVFAAVLAVHRAGWVDLVPLGLTIVVAHLGLLLWETRYVSASLAFPGLRPRLATTKE
jgi:hypothetical protein